MRGADGEWGLKVCAGWYLEMLVVVNTKGGNVPCSVSRTLFQYRRMLFLILLHTIYLFSVVAPGTKYFVHESPFYPDKSSESAQRNRIFFNIIRVPEWLKGWSRPQTKECRSLVLPEPWCIQCRNFSNN